MNAFADWLFSTLFGWMGTAANSVWNATVNASGGISSFFSKYWLVFVLIIIAGGTVVDYAVWFARWRPHLVWRSWLSRSLRQRKSRRYAQDLEQTDMDEASRDTLADWVSTPQESFAVQNLNDSFPYGDSFQSDEQYMQPPAKQYFGEQNDMVRDASQDTGYYDTPYPQNNAAYWPQTNQGQYADFQQQYDSTSSQTDWSTSDSQPFDEYVPHVMNEQEFDNNAANQFNSFELSADQTFGEFQPVYETEPGSQYSNHDITPTSRRQRRSQRSKKTASTRRFFNQIKERMGQSDDQESMLDGLPSPVKQEDAFHQAVYPQSYHYQDVPRTDNDERFDHN